MKKIITTQILILLMFLDIYSQDKTLKEIFSSHNITGTIIIQSEDCKVTYSHNKKRHTSRFIPASTFKIPNTLISLETNAIKDEYEIIKWDGIKRSYETWNQDQNLMTAFKYSCVWFYQELARKVGMTNYLYYLKKMNYGNMKTGPKVETFWLDGDIKISAAEQIELLKKLYRNKLPFKTENQNLLKKIMLLDSTDKYMLYAKTGLAMRVKKEIGWFVGYVVKNDNVWYFAMNMDIMKRGDENLRKQIVYEGLKAKGII